MDRFTLAAVKKALQRLLPSNTRPMSGSCCCLETDLPYCFCLAVTALNCLHYGSTAGQYCDGMLSKIAAQVKIDFTAVETMPHNLHNNRVLTSLDTQHYCVEISDNCCFSM